jgi:hypothetical protein
MSIGELNEGLPTHGDQIPFITAKGFAGELLLNRLEECNRLLLCRLLKFCHLCDVDIPEQRSRRYSICGVERKGDALRRGCRSWPPQFLPSMIPCFLPLIHLLRPPFRCLNLTPADLLIHSTRAPQFVEHDDVAGSSAPRFVVEDF